MYFGIDIDGCDFHSQSSSMHGVHFYGETECFAQKLECRHLWTGQEVGSCNLAQMCSISGAMNTSNCASVHLSVSLRVDFRKWCTF